MDLPVAKYEFSPLRRIQKDPRPQFSKILYMNRKENSKSSPACPQRVVKGEKLWEWIRWQLSEPCTKEPCPPMYMSKKALVWVLAN